MSIHPEDREAARLWKAEQRHKEPARTFIQLGAYGDIISALPLLYWESVERAEKPSLVVSKRYADILEGVSYVNPIVLDVHYSQLTMAEAAVKARNPVTLQVYGKPFQYLTESYQRDAWAQVGYGQRWEQLGLVFGQRDEKRETALVAAAFQDVVPGIKPVVVCTAGASSAFPHKAKLHEALDAFVGKGRWVDVDNLRADRIYDMLGVIDNASLLISNDTALLHLAQATSTPVIALVNEADNGWLGSLRRANHMLYRRFPEFDAEEVVGSAVLFGREYVGQVVHTYSAFDMSADERRRHEVASSTWEFPVLAMERADQLRDASIIGDKPVPFVKDVIEHGLKHGDAVVLTNTDTGLTQCAESKIRRLLKTHGSCFAYRFEHEDITKPPTYHENIRGAWRGGVELVAVTREWWKNYKRLVPDLLLGRQWWDIVFRDVIKMTGGGELYGCVFHEFHESDWKKGDKPGNEHNHRLYVDFMKRYDTTRPFAGLHLLGR